MDEQQAAKSSDTFRQILIGVLIAILTGIFFLMSYQFEVSYLEALGLPKPIASVVAQVDMHTYFWFMSGVLTLAVLTAILISTFTHSEKLKRLLANAKFIYAATAALLILIIAQQILLRAMGVGQDSTLAYFLVLVIAVATIPVAISFQWAIIRGWNIPWDEIKRNKAEFFDAVNIWLLLPVLLFFVFALGKLILATSENIAQLQAVANRTNTIVTIDDRQYVLMRDYGARLILSNRDRTKFYSVNTDSMEVIEYANERYQKN